MVLLVLFATACGRSNVDVFEHDLTTDGGADTDQHDDGAVDSDFPAVTVPAGTFIMGSPPSEPCREPWDEQETAHQVQLTYAYAMLTTEVTQAQWRAVMGAFPAAQAVDCDACPVVNVTWQEAADFCEALSGVAGLASGWRLPSEAEWERARRAGTTGSLYEQDITTCGSDPTLEPFAWYQATTSDGAPTVRPTATKAPNAFGLHDMTGNAWEWCADWDVHDLGSAAVIDPLITTASGFRVARGGGYSDRAEALRAAMRDSNRPTDRFDYLGFRCVRRQ